VLEGCDVAAGAAAAFNAEVLELRKRRVGGNAESGVDVWARVAARMQVRQIIVREVCLLSFNGWPEPRRARDRVEGAETLDLGRVICFTDGRGS